MITRSRLETVAKESGFRPIAVEKVMRSFLRYQLTAYPFADERLHGQMRRLLSLDEPRQDLGSVDAECLVRRRRTGVRGRLRARRAAKPGVCKRGQQCRQRAV